MKKLKENLILNNLNEEEKKEIWDIPSKFPYQFFLPGDKLGHTNVTQHSIELTDNIPINSKYPRYPKIHIDEIKKQTEDLLKNELILPSNPPYNSPVWIIPKKEDPKGNKRWRMVTEKLSGTLTLCQILPTFWTN